MFERLLSALHLHPTYETPLPDADADHAFGALLVRVAKADDTYRVEELQRIDQILAKRLDLNPVEAAKFRAECEKLETAMPDTDTLSEILVANIDQPTRESMVQAMWEVLMADGYQHRSEEAVVAQVAAVFGVGETKH